MIKKILLTILFATFFWLLMGDAFAAITLDDSMRPNNLPGFTAVEVDENAAPETAATRTLIVYVGNIVSQVLLFAGAIIIFFLIIAGSDYILAFGKDERIERGKRGIFWAILGLVIIMLSYAIVRGLIGIVLQTDVTA
ncbi:hypothetical protein KKC94_05995 [Patescibacteria group bacterium]|nr:hypothetical protein [Patescibacteria group bacterium]